MAVLVKRLTECARLIVNVVHVHVKVGQSSFESARDNNITVSNTNVHHSNAYHIQNFILLFICLYLKKGLYKEETGALPHPVIQLKDHGHDSLYFIFYKQNLQERQLTIIITPLLFFISLWTNNTKFRIGPFSFEKNCMSDYYAAFEPKLLLIVLFQYRYFQILQMNQW